MEGATQEPDQTDIWTLLDPLSRQLNAFTARKRQLQLVKRLHETCERLHETVEVMENNALPDSPEWKKTLLETPLHKL
ncbi:hypothetical protein F7725_008714 [Dissostichus mawsoni]|uniref:Uncharacterized protein n=1 Tax=Dissostichus mawsoni TaxID=36200 RepID=A0A7J5Y9B7_DISMA|nr:hypothetical protein F7725_008714 [Dissostichus mawsoni]